MNAKKVSITVNKVLAKSKSKMFDLHYSTVISKLDSKFQIRENLILSFLKVENRSFLFHLIVYLFIIYILA